MTCGPNTHLQIPLLLLCGVFFASHADAQLWPRGPATCARALSLLVDGDLTTEAVTLCGLTGLEERQGATWTSRVFSASTAADGAIASGCVL